jgi:SAM-dependent methyltransferase
VPANCSRYFSSYEESLEQPVGRISLKMNLEKTYVYNSLYQEELTLHDKNYCTSNAFQLKLSVENFLSTFKESLSQRIIIDIGCGQGEFVTEMSRSGYEAFGFDPVLRSESDNLFPEYYSPDKLSTQGNRIFVMRCVLPHIENPMLFLRNLISDAEDIVYLEFQRIEWITENNLWSQISHDHVNYFSTDSFNRDFEVLKTGTFAEGEWGYVCLKKGKSKSDAIPENLSKLIFMEEKIPSMIQEISKHLNSPFAIYGAAGKGILFAFELYKLGIKEFVAIDENHEYWGKYLECSGVEVVNPIKFSDLKRSDTLLVMNPNHYLFAKEKFAGVLNVKNISKLI